MQRFITNDFFRMNMRRHSFFFRLFNHVTHAYQAYELVFLRVNNGSNQRIATVVWRKLDSNLPPQLPSQRSGLISAPALQGLVSTALRCYVDKEFTINAGIAKLIYLIGYSEEEISSQFDSKLLNLILKAYLTIIRGTPTMVQLLIIYYVIFASTNVDKVFVAVIAFGLNSSAYIAEIVRSGIMSVDAGQFEAGRSLGFNYAQTMRYFILPQAFKNVLPALCNEFIVLIKETSISGYIGIMDLTRGGDYIRSRTYEAFMPLIAVALVYLVIVVVLTSLVSRLEKRLKNNEK